MYGAGFAAAQEHPPGLGPIEVTYMPAGAGFVGSKGSLPSFGNYGFANEHAGGARSPTLSSFSSDAEDHAHNLERRLSLVDSRLVLVRI
jgi:hypothetical protein